MARFVLEFEKPFLELVRKIEEMKKLQEKNNLDLSSEISLLEKKLTELQKKTYSGLTRWQRVRVARHPDRPYTLDYVRMIVTDFIEIHGDRNYADDKAIVTGFGTIGGHKFVLIGQQKGRDTKENIKRNFGMPHPEGYRKALRAMKLGERFGLPVVSFIDTPGAFPGVGAEERGQAEAIARNLFEMARLGTPIIIVIIGEGASGGALGIGIGDVVLMFENAWYTVISPEGCAAILWRDKAKAPEAAEALKLSARDLLELGMIDRIIPEPPGGAHWNPEKMAETLKKEIIKEIERFKGYEPEKLIERRLQRYRDMGVYREVKNARPKTS
ncbi:acetyl-CoA carboxylase carboxyltransferase subunit alpha [bacterium]|nr:acetyl-CoA carboxylase carboxyltransferase subunit alpha [bacterium]